MKERFHLVEAIRDNRVNKFYVSYGTRENALVEVEANEEGAAWKTTGLKIAEIDLGIHAKGLAYADFYASFSDLGEHLEDIANAMSKGQDPKNKSLPESLKEIEVTVIAAIEFALENLRPV